MKKSPQIGFPGLAPRSGPHLCFTMIEGSNRRREGGDVSRGFRVPRATDWQGPIGFFVASPFPTWRRTHFPSTLNSCLPPGYIRRELRMSGGRSGVLSCSWTVTCCACSCRFALIAKHRGWRSAYFAGRPFGAAGMAVAAPVSPVPAIGTQARLDRP